MELNCGSVDQTRMTKYHIHHIVPKHAGGTNDPTNLVRLTVAEHAEEHRKLYEKDRNHYDYLAWKGLSASINILYEPGYCWYHDPITKKRFKYLPGDEPASWMPGMKPKIPHDPVAGKEIRKQKLVENQPCGLGHHHAKLWTLEDPEGNTFPDVVLNSFCKTHNLAASSLKENFKGSRGKPVSKGKSKGWRITSVRPIPVK